MRTERLIKLPIAIVSLLLLVVGVSGGYYVHRLQKKASRILSENVASIIAAEELELQVRAVRYELNQFLITGDAAYLGEAAKLRGRVEKHLRDAEEFATTGSEQQVVAQLHSALESFFSDLARLATEPSSLDAHEQVGDLTSRVLTDEVISNARRYLDLNEAELTKSNQQNQDASDRLAIALLLLGTCGSVAGLVAGYGMARSVSRSIFQLTVSVRDVAGKLDEVVEPVVVSADPGLGDLDTVLRKLSAKVESVVEQLHKTHRKTMRAEQLAALGQLAAGLAHEIRNPLMCMKVLVQSARRGRSGPLEPRDLQVLDEEITRLESRLQEFVDFARPAQLAKKPVDVRELVTQTTHLVAPRAGQRNVRIHTSIPDDPLVLECDAVQIRQVLLNLLLNALDAVSNGGRIDVRLYQGTRGTREQQGSGDFVVLEVADNGRGLVAATAERIFEPFFSTKDSGLGLGLATSRRIVELHGGEITACNRHQGGASFHVYIPTTALLASPPVRNGEAPANAP